MYATAINTKKLFNAILPYSFNAKITRMTDYFYLEVILTNNKFQCYNTNAKENNRKSS